MTTNDFQFHGLGRSGAEAIAAWRYPNEYSTHDVLGNERESAVAYMADPANGFYGVYRDEELIGFCSLGADGRVPGGSYDHSALDVGAGMRPDRLGQGQGAAFLHEVVSFLSASSGEKSLRATIASWNARALRADRAAGFEPRARFADPARRKFTLLVWERQ